MGIQELEQNLIQSIAALSKARAERDAAAENLSIQNARNATRKDGSERQDQLHAEMMDESRSRLYFAERNYDEKARTYAKLSSLFEETIKAA